MKERVVYEVRWLKGLKYWVSMQRGQPAVEWVYHVVKYLALPDARERARRHAPSQLVVRGKNGRIQYEHTYGADPKRHKG